MTDTIKLLLKLSAPDKGSRWMHLCYINRELHVTYSKKFGHLNNNSLSRWGKQDFGVDMEVCTVEDLDKLKALVKAYYSEKYPEVYYDSTTDHQGWLRLWITNKMKEELYGKVSK